MTNILVIISPCRANLATRWQHDLANCGTCYKYTHPWSPWSRLLIAATLRLPIAPPISFCLFLAFLFLISWLNLSSLVCGDEGVSSSSNSWRAEFHLSFPSPSALPPLITVPPNAPLTLIPSSQSPPSVPPPIPTPLPHYPLFIPPLRSAPSVFLSQRPLPQFLLP